MERLDSLFRVTSCHFIKESVQNNKKKNKSFLKISYMEAFASAGRLSRLTAMRLNAGKSTEERRWSQVDKMEAEVRCMKGLAH